MMGLAIPKLTMKNPWEAPTREMALFRWWMNMISCTISGISASTAPAPKPWKHRAARWLFKLVEKPAHNPPVHAIRPANSSTGRRPTAMDKGTRMYEAMPLTSSGSEASRATLYSGGPPRPARMDSGLRFTTPGGLREEMSIWLRILGSMPAYSSTKTGTRAPMMNSPARARAPKKHKEPMAAHFLHSGRLSGSLGSGVGMGM